MTNDSPNPNQTAPPDKRPNLSDPQVVEKILVGLAREAIGCRMAAARDIITEQDANTIEEKEIQHRTFIFLNRDKGYAAVADWNVPGKIDTFLANELQLQARGPENVLKATFQRFVDSVREKVNVAENPNVPELQWKEKIRDLVSAYRDVLMGKPMVQLQAAIPATATPDALAENAPTPAPRTLTAPGLKSDRFLGDPEVVEQILIDLCAASLKAHRAVTSNFITIQDAAIIEEKEIEAATQIFLGHDIRFTIDPTWNVSGALEKHLSKELDIDPTLPDGVVKIAITRYLGDVRDILNVPEGAALAEIEWKAIVAPLVHSYKKVFLGLPADHIEIKASAGAVPEMPTEQVEALAQLAAQVAGDTSFKPIKQVRREPAQAPAPTPAAPAPTPEIPKAAPTPEPPAPVVAAPTPKPAPAPAPVEKSKVEEKIIPLPVAEKPAPKQAAAAPAEEKKRGGFVWKAAALIAFLAIVSSITVVYYKQQQEKKRLAEEKTRQEKAKAEEQAKAAKPRGPKVFILKNGKIVTDKGVEIPSQVSIANGANGNADFGDAANKPLLFWYDLNATGEVAKFLVARQEDPGFEPQPDSPIAYDLWFTDELGHEKFIARSAFRAKFSPDGSKIAYTSSDCVLHVIDLEGKELATTDRAYEPNWSQDGKLIVFEHVPEGREEYPAEAFQLARFFWQDGKIDIVDDGRFDDVIPHYHPSNQWILFVSGTRSGGTAFWKIPAIGGEPVQLTNVSMNEGNNDFIPTPYQTSLWSADGRWFVYDFKMDYIEQTWGLEFDEKGNFKGAKKLADGISPQWTGPSTFVSQKRAGEGFEMIQEKLPGT